MKIVINGREKEATRCIDKAIDDFEKMDKELNGGDFHPSHYTLYLIAKTYIQEKKFPPPRLGDPSRRLDCVGFDPYAKTSGPSEK